MNTMVESLLDKYLQSPGKLIRPRLIQLFGKGFHLKEMDINSISRAAEMIHNASLIHDDVIDQAETRRGKKTLNRIVSNSQAVLAGDYLLAKVIAEVVDAGHFSILKTLACTLEEIVEGEFLQDSLKETGDSTFESLTNVARKKTGSLLGWSCSAPAEVAGQSSGTIQTCKEIGIKLGVAFQMIDDNLDYSNQSGKDFGKDLKEGLINFTTLELLSLYPEHFYSIHQLRKKPFNQVPWSFTQLQEASYRVQSKAQLIVNEVKDLIRVCGVTNSDEIIAFIDLIQERTK